MTPTNWCAQCHQDKNSFVTGRCENYFVDSSFISVWSVMMRTHLVTDCDIRDTEEVGPLWGHLSPSNPRHWDTLVKVTQLSSALAAKIQLISSDNHSELRCSPLIGCWDSSLSSHWLRHELLVNLIHDLWYTFPRYWHWHMGLTANLKNLEKLL